MATSDRQNLVDMANLIIEDNDSTIDAIEKMRHELERWRDGFSTAEALRILREFSAAKAEFTVRVKEIMER